MKKIILLSVIVAGIAACQPVSKATKAGTYPGMYAQKPVTVLLMPPINKSLNVEAKEYFHSTLSVPVVNAGYYVIPPFMSLEILKRESAFDAELFLEKPLKLFGEVFGADLALFTIIHKWDKSGLMAKVYVDVEYIVRSVSTNEVVFARRGQVTYDASIASNNNGGLVGALVNMAASAINTALTQYVDVARACNVYTLKDLPAGLCSPRYELDGEDAAGSKIFQVQLNSSY